MNLQIILCVEADKRAAADNIYIKETINRFYSYGNDTKLTFVNMGGKSKYNSKSVERQVAQLIHDYKIGKTVVIYCIDLDGFEANPDQVKENLEIQAYAQEKGYELVWFCHDVEEVYCGESVDKGIKTKTAIEFKTKGMIERLEEKRLMSKKETKRSSNILYILDKYIERKEKV